MYSENGVLSKVYPLIIGFITIEKNNFSRVYSLNLNTGPPNPFWNCSTVSDMVQGETDMFILTQTLSKTFKRYRNFLLL